LRLEFLQARIQVRVVILLLFLQRIHRVLQHFVLTAQGDFLAQTFQLVLHVELGRLFWSIRWDAVAWKPLNWSRLEHRRRASSSSKTPACAEWLPAGRRRQRPATAAWKREHS
jgi:hypothetical protein